MAFIILTQVTPSTTGWSARPAPLYVPRMSRPFWEPRTSRRSTVASTAADLPRIFVFAASQKFLDPPPGRRIGIFGQGRERKEVHFGNLVIGPRARNFLKTGDLVKGNVISTALVA